MSIMKNKWKLILVIGVMCLLAGCGSKEADEETNQEANVKGDMLIDDVFKITDRGTVATGTVESGKICVGDKAVLIKEDGTEIETEIVALEQFRKLIEEANEGEIVGAQLEGVEKEEVDRGDRLIVYEE